MIARIEARVDEGKAVIFSNLSRHQFSHRARCGMKIGARNRLTDGIVDGKEGASPARLLRNRHCGTCSPKQSLSFGIWPVTSFVRPKGLLERSKTVCEGPSPEKPMDNAQGRPGKCCGGGGYLSTGNPPPKIDEAVSVGYRLSSGC